MEYRSLKEILSHKFSIIPLFLFLVTLPGWMQQTSAQSDNLLVPWETSPGSQIPKIDALYHTVLGDTNANGERANLNRVYILQKGGFYQNTENFKNKDKNGVSYPLRFVGETPDPGNSIGNPPVLQMSSRSDGSINGKILTGYGDVYMKNIYVIGSDANGIQTYYQPMEFETDNACCIFDSCYFERSNWAITAWYGKNNVIKFTNCKWFNLVERPVTYQWAGRGITCWADQDSVIVENCTFDNVGMCAIQIEGGAAKYFRFVHNTLINVGRSIHSTNDNWWREAYFADNLFINTFFGGEGWIDYSNQVNPNRTSFYTGLMAISPLPYSYGPDLARRIVFAKNSAFLDYTFKKEWADTVRIQPFCNSETDSFFNTYSRANGGQMVAQDTVWLTSLPNFTKFDTTNYRNMIHWIEDIRAGISPGPSFMQDLNISGTDTFWTAPQWPIVQNFAYTPDSNTTGTDGLPLGDLNWFPTQLANWNANSTLYILNIKNIAGSFEPWRPPVKVEAESCEVGGTAVKAALQALTYYDYSGNGSITWTFNAPSAGLYDTKWLVNETGRSQSGPNLAINGTQIHDKAHGWGQFIFDPLLGPSRDMPNNSWIWVPITKDTVLANESSAFTLKGGPNTIGVVGGGWGEMKFAEVDVVLHGSIDTIKLKAPDAVPLLVIPGVEGNPKWIPSGFKYVSMGTAGILKLNYYIPKALPYRFGIFYQNVNGIQAATMTIDTNVYSIYLPGNADSTSVGYLSPIYNLNQGNNTIIISAGNINLDFIAFYPGYGAVSKDNQKQLSFSLDQNYPNPFNPSTSIGFSLVKTTKVELSIYNILGQKVVTIINGEMNAGPHAVQFNAGNLASGVYFYGIKTREFEIYKKMMILK